MRKALILLILFAFSVPAYGATVYKWVDEKGVVNFTDEYQKVPPIFRNRVETEEYLEEEPPLSFLRARRLRLVKKSGPIFMAGITGGNS
jgi:hypothetical protein